MQTNKDGQPPDHQRPTFFDKQWRNAAIAGDASAIARLASECVEPLYRFCFYRVGRRRDLSEEVVQETLVRAIRDLAKYEPDRSRNDIFPWLTGLARNEINRALRHQQNAASLQALWQRMDDELRSLYARLESEPFSDEVLAREETREMVGATMSQLPAKYREALEAKYVSGKSVRDMATMLAVTEKAVESQLGRARRAFRETFLTLAKNLDVELDRAYTQ